MGAEERKEKREVATPRSVPLCEEGFGEAKRGGRTRERGGRGRSATAVGSLPSVAESSRPTVTHAGIHIQRGDAGSKKKKNTERGEVKSGRLSDRVLALPRSSAVSRFAASLRAATESDTEANALMRLRCIRHVFYGDMESSPPQDEDK
jgi:hypothetical protein